MKVLMSKYPGEFELYVFGSAVKGDYFTGLSDIDVAIVSDEFESRENKLRVYDVLFDKYLNSPFEFHLLTMKEWKFFLRFIKEGFVKV